MDNFEKNKKDWKIEVYKFFVDKQIDKIELEFNRVDEVRQSTNNILGAVLILSGFSLQFFKDLELPTFRFIILFSCVVFIILFWILKINKTISINSHKLNTYATLENRKVKDGELFYRDEQDEYYYWKRISDKLDSEYQKIKKDIGEILRLRDLFLYLSIALLIIIFLLLIIPENYVQIDISI